MNHPDNNSPTNPSSREVRKPRRELISAMAYAVESLSTQALADTGGAIRALLACDKAIWDHLDESTIEILDEGLGIKRP